MTTKIHPHAKARIEERGATEDEAIMTIEKGESFPAKFNRTGFRHNFPFNSIRKGKTYNTKQVEAYAIKENDDWIILTVITKFF